MVPVVVAVRVFMREALVRMFVAVGFDQVQHHAEHHQHAAGRQQHGGGFVRAHPVGAVEAVDPAGVEVEEVENDVADVGRR
eukprot:gene37999-61410_t